LFTVIAPHLAWTVNVWDVPALFVTVTETTTFVPTVTDEDESDTDPRLGATKSNVTAAVRDMS
jgi:hypothetical protein